MPPKEVTQVCKLLSRLPVQDQLATVLISIVRVNSDALDVALRMLGATSMLSKHLGVKNRHAIAEKMRDCADALERRPDQQQVVRID